MPSPDIFPEFSPRPLREKVETDSRFFSYEILLRFSNGIVFEDSFPDKFLCFVLLDRTRNTESFHAIINSRIRSRSDLLLFVGLLRSMHLSERNFENTVAYLHRLRVTFFLFEQHSYLFGNKKIKYAENTASDLATLLSRTKNTTTRTETNEFFF